MPTTLNGPVGLVSDGQGHLYVTNAFDYTIRMINLADMKVSLIAGASGVQGSTDSPPRFKQPAALLYENNHLWVSDEVDCTVRKIDLAGPTVSTVAGTPGTCHLDDGAGAAGHFVRPRGLALYNGDLYVADEGSLRKLQPSPSPAPLTTVVANGTWVGATGIASAGGGVFYVIDEAYTTLHRMTLPNTNELVAGSDGYPQDFVDGVGSVARFADPRWLILDGAGAAYVSEGAAIRKVDLTSFNVSTLAGMSPQSDRTDSPRALRAAERRGLRRGRHPIRRRIRQQRHPQGDFVDGKHHHLRRRRRLQVAGRARHRGVVLQSDRPGARWQRQPVRVG